MTWILTATGQRFDLANPTPAMVNPFDMAHALASICRFNGHTAEHYSVAEHSIRVGALVPPEDRLAALLHDATEAYIGDVSSPLKAMLPEYRRIEARIHSAICQRFAIPEEIPASVKRADLIMLATERRDLMPSHRDSWPALDGIEPDATVIDDPMPEKLARREYLNLLLDLMPAEVCHAS